MPPGPRLLALQLTLAIASACGDSVTRPESDVRPPLPEWYDDKAAEAADAPACSDVTLPWPAVTHWAGSGHEDSTCWAAFVDHGDDPEADDNVVITTLCRDDRCICLLNDEPLCACQTEGAWCEEVVPSCCPPPFP